MPKANCVFARSAACHRQAAIWHKRRLIVANRKARHRTARKSCRQPFPLLVSGPRSVYCLMKLSGRNLYGKKIVAIPVFSPPKILFSAGLFSGDCRQLQLLCMRETGSLRRQWIGFQRGTGTLNIFQAGDRNPVCVGLEIPCLQRRA